MVTIGKILRATPRITFSRARAQCKIKLAAKPTIEVDEIGVYKHVVYNVVATDGPRYVEFKLYAADGDATMHSRAYVHCSCPAFLYNHEVALLSRGSSSKINSNGEYPEIRNPKLIPSACKHVAATAHAAVKVKAKPMAMPEITEDDIKNVLHEMRDRIPVKRARPKPTTPAAPKRPKPPAKPRGRR